MKIAHRLATLDDAVGLMPRMRKDDEREILAMGVEPAYGLGHSMRAAIRSWALTFDGEVAAIWGIGTENLIGTVGVPWLLSTPLVDRHPVAFARYSIARVAEMRAMFPELHNIVDARYTKCIRWLQFLKFHVEPAAPMGPYGLPFHHFHSGT